MPAPVVRSRAGLYLVDAEPATFTWDPADGYEEPTSILGLMLVSKGAGMDPNVPGYPTFGGVEMGRDVKVVDEFGQGSLYQLSLLDAASRSGNGWWSSLRYTNHSVEMLGLKHPSGVVDLVAWGKGGEASYSGTPKGPTLDPNGRDCTVIIIATEMGGKGADMLTKWTLNSVGGVAPTVIKEQAATSYGAYRIAEVPLPAAGGPQAVTATFNWPSTRCMILAAAYAGSAASRKRNQAIVVI